MAARFLTLRGTGEKIQEKGLISHQKFTFKSTRHLHAGGRISTQYFLYTIPNKDCLTDLYQKCARKKWEDMFCVLWLEQRIFVCNTFKKFVQYKIGFMGFFFFCHHNRMARLEEWKTWTLGFDSGSEDFRLYFQWVYKGDGSYVDCRNPSGRSAFHSEYTSTAFRRCAGAYVQSCGACV